ncbi:FtsQ-type POTRA domain-containing protein [Corynebacterium poyangense]|uniref:FtsQ-type POTRA domain-containing protein n=1 Tax=Corynebacterium poyangense TaxID=2684405 RepID=A0A7H0SPT3_9CORY|nr:FtsQ-type POTRA domain-containing protein [Corynebacterium poyangense]QNQ90558.1 FtsQ-type POTRA domain-containing protein [Corynebacterium poyangense]
MNIPFALPSLRKTLLIVGSLVAVLLIAAGVLLLTPILAVRTIEVNGAEHSDVAEIQNQSGITVGDNLLRLDTSKAAQAVAQIPWVRSVTVSRVLPSTARIDITERQAPLYRDDNGQHNLIDENGDVFFTAEPPQGSVAVTGSGSHNQEVLQSLAQAISTIPENLRGNIGHADINDNGSITLYLKDNRTVYWGAPENNQNKAIALESVLTFPDGNWNISNPGLITRRN